MTQKVFFVTLLLICVFFSTSAYATEKTIAETRWANFMETTDLQYPAHDGQFSTDYTMRLLLFYYFDPAKEGNILDSSCTANGVYSLSKNIELRGSYSNSELINDLWTVKESLLGLKVKCYQNQTFALAVSPAVSFIHDEYLGDKTTILQGGVSVFTNLNLGKFVKLYNNFGYIRPVDRDVVHSQKKLTNALEFDITSKNIIRVLHTGDFVHTNDINHNFGVTYRGQYSDKLTYIFSMQRSDYFYGDTPQKYVYINNLIEYKPTKNLILTGQFEKYNPQCYADYIQVDATQQMGKLQLACGFTHSFPYDVEGGRVTAKNQLAGTVKYHFTKHWALSFGGNCKTSYSREHTTFYRTLTLKTALVWE